LRGNWKDSCAKNLIAGAGHVAAALMEEIYFGESSFKFGKE